MRDLRDDPTTTMRVPATIAWATQPISLGDSTVSCIA